MADYQTIGLQDSAILEEVIKKTGVEITAELDFTNKKLRVKAKPRNGEGGTILIISHTDLAHWAELLVEGRTPYPPEDNSLHHCLDCNSENVKDGRVRCYPCYESAKGNHCRRCFRSYEGKQCLICTDQQLRDYDDAKGCAC